MLALLFIVLGVIVLGQQLYTLSTNRL
jgi:hypothetical protein